MEYQFNYFGYHNLSGDLFKKKGELLLRNVFSFFKLNIDNLEMYMFKKFPIDRSTGGRVLEKVRAWSKQTHIYLQGKPLSLRTGKMCL